MLNFSATSVTVTCIHYSISILHYVLQDNIWMSHVVIVYDIWRTTSEGPILSLCMMYKGPPLKVPCCHCVCCIKDQLWRSHVVSVYVVWRTNSEGPMLSLCMVYEVDLILLISTNRLTVNWLHKIQYNAHVHFETLLKIVRVCIYV